MRNILFLGLYILGILCLFGARDKFQRVRVDFVSSVGLLLAIALLSLKGYSLYRAGNYIPPELIAPTYLTSDAEAMKKGPVDKAVADIFAAAKSQGTQNRDGDFPVLEKFLAPSADPAGVHGGTRAQKEWILKNDFTPGAATMYRGRFLHHYSTILFPFRQLVIDKKYSMFASSQYGFASILPLFFMQKMDFIWYPLLSLPIIFIYIAVVWHILRVYSSRAPGLLCAILLLLVAIDSNQGALRISPGFAFFRYFPAFISISVLLLSLKVRNAALYVPIMFLAAVTNAFQINILVLLVGGLFFGMKWVKTRKFDVHELIVLSPILFVVIFQAAMYFGDGNLLKVAAFGSVGAGRSSLKQTSLILLFPAVTLFLAYLRDNIREMSPEEFFSYLAYGFFATYSMSFAFSPQHYVGFILFSLSPIAIILNRTLGSQNAAGPGGRSNYWYLLVAVGVLFGASRILNFMNLPVVEESSPDFQRKSVLVGSALRFNTPSRLDLLAEDMSRLLRNRHLSRRDVYIFSKDKIFMELFSNVNYLPENYDSFLNFPRDTNDIFRQAKNDGVRFIVMDSPRQFEMTVEYLRFRLSLQLDDGSELRAHLDLLGRIKDFTASPRLTKVECSERWCLYRID